MFFSLTLTVRGVSNKHCLLTFFISMAILLPSADSRRVVGGYKRKYVHKILVNCLVKLAQEKSVIRCTDHPNIIIAVDLDIKNQTKQNQQKTYVVGTH